VSIKVETWYLIIAAVAVFSIGHYMVRRSQAQDRARQWLAAHHYRVRSFRTAWFGAMTFRTLYRNSDRAFNFIAEVDDTQLGGTGRVRLRVWADWLGMINNEVEVDWLEQPKGGEVGTEPLMDRLADAQLDILRRVSAGETAFYAPRPNEEGAEGFDEFVEHVHALGRRGMLMHGVPVEDGRRNRGRYSSIGSLSITPGGRKWLESQSAPIRQ
jgi:hypothetical protein